jgi:dimethylaniline monooxygenase (N-oxide forming)
MEEIICQKQIKCNKQKTLCIIGFGVSGILSAKYALERNLKIKIFELRDDLGGTWAENGSAWPSVKAITDTNIMSFLNHSWPNDIKEEYPLKEDVYNYVKQYAKTHRLIDYVSFNTKVIKVRRISNGKVIEVTYQKNDEIYIEEFDFLTIATGVHQTPRMILDEIPKQNCEIEIIHSKYYRSPEPFKGKKVLVYGHSTSAFQICEELIPFASQVTNLFRTPYWVLSRYINYNNQNVPLTMFFFSNRENRKNLSQLGEGRFKISNNLLSKIYNQNDFHPALYIDPDTPDRPNIGVGHNYLQMCKEEKILPVKGEISKILGNMVLLNTGEAIETDIIILCSGLKPELSFLDEELLNTFKVGESIDSHKANIDLDYMRIANSNIHNITFIGVHNNYTWNSLEMGVVLALDFMLSNGQKRNNKLSENYDVWDFLSYWDMIAEEAGMLPNFEKIKKEDEELAKYISKGPMMPQHYLLNDIEFGSKEYLKLRQEIVDFNKRFNLAPVN